MAPNKSDLAEDEKLSECVRQYEVLYKKAHKDYKDKRMKDAHWAKIDTALGKEPGASSQSWVLLLNRYSRRRMAFKAANVSGQGAEQMKKVKQDLEEYKFLSWFDAYVRPKKSKTNLPEAASTEETLNVSLESNDEPFRDLPSTPQTQREKAQFQHCPK